MYQYLLCGLKVGSDIAFPELLAWEGPDDSPVEIEFRLGPVESTNNADEADPSFEVQEPGKLTFVIPRVGRLLIDQGRRITFDALAGVDPDRVRLNFIGIVQAILWHQRGHLPLHASAVMIGPSAIGIAGASRCGKSVLAAALVQQGHELVADDFAIIDWASGAPAVLPGYQRLRLWRDACLQFDLLGNTIAKAHPVLDKHVVPTDRLFRGARAPLSHLFIIGQAGGRFSAHRLSGAQAVQNLAAVVHTMEPARSLGLQFQIFQAIGAILANVALWQLTIPQDLQGADETALTLAELASA